jgi:predicted nucleotidyltransferase
MIIQQPWQHAFIEALRQHLYTNEDILALVVFGSAAKQMAIDLWSDVDVLVVTTDEGISTFFPDVEWLRPLAPIYGYEQHSSERTHTTRLCFTDMRRVDLVFMTETALKQTDQAIFWQPGRVVFSKVSAVTEQLLKPNNISAFSLPNPEDFERMVEQFWYRSTVAVYKVIREDWLIAWHLSLELIQDCCVLGMMLRDRREQTNHHRSGGMGNDLLAQLPTFPESYSATAILEVIAQTAVLFDDLAGQWSEAYEGRKRPLLPWIESLIGDSD